MNRLFTALVMTAFFFPFSVIAAVVGDVDGDGKIELSEAIYALQVASGYYPDVDNSCQLVGKNDWSDYTTYVKCDVVKEDGFFYICTTNHFSSATFTTDSANWTLLALSANWDKNNSDIYYNNGKVGIGTTAPEAKLDVRGQMKVSEGIHFADDTTQTTAFPGIGPGSGLDADTIDGLQASELMSYAGSSIPPGSKFPVPSLEIEGIELPDSYQYTLDGRTFQTNIEVIEFQEGDDPLIRKRPGRTSYGSLTLSHVIPTGSTSEINNWYGSIIDGTFFSRAIILKIHEANPTTSLIINYYGAWPSAISHSPLSSGQWEETFVLTFEEMEITSNTPLNITATNYAEIDTLPEHILFQEFSGGSTSTEIEEFQDDDFVLRKRPGATQFTDLNFIGTGARSGMLMWNWYMAISDGTFSKKTVLLKSTGQSGSKAYSGCWPSGFAGLSANTEAGITFDQITVTCDEIMGSE